MGLFEGKTPAERNKTIAALVLGLAALVLVLRMFFGGDSRPTRPAAATNASKGGATTSSANGAGQAADADAVDASLTIPDPVPDIVTTSYTVPDAARNIFAFPPVPVQTVVIPVATEVPTPTPTPPPPVALNAVSPANVFARTGDFTLELSGDKFTPETRVFIDGQEVQTAFKGAQQLTAQVPAALISAQGARTVAVRTPDGSLYSNTATINVMAPPAPQVTFIGFYGDKGQAARDRAILKPNQPRQPNELVALQRGDLLPPDGRFKLVSISDRAVEFEDTQLKIKHTIPFSDNRGANPPTGPGGRLPPQPPPPTGDDDEP